MNDGAFWVHRKLEYSSIWTASHATFKGFMACLLFANYKDQQWYSRAEHKQVVIGRGSFFTTWKTFSSRSGLTEQQTRDCFKTLEDLDIITCRATRRGTYITILNYDTYQNVRTYRGTSRATDKERNENVMRTQLEEGKEGKERKEGESPPGISLSEYVNGWKQRPEWERKENAATIAEGLKKFKLAFRTEEDLYQQIMGEEKNGTIRSKSIFEQAAERHGKGGLKKVGGDNAQWEVLARLRDLPKVSPKTGLIDGGRSQSDDKPI